MKTSANIKSEVRELFKKMHTKEDLLQILNRVKSIIYKGKSFPFSMNQLTWYYTPKSQSKRYFEFTIKKKSGKLRSIHSPVAGLKEIQRCLAFMFNCIFESHESSFGFITGYSIADNASKHIGSKYVYNIDLKDFFPSIDQARVWKCLQLKPFNLEGNENPTKVGCYEDATIEIKNKIQILFINYQGLNLTSGLWNIEDKASQNISYKINVSNKNRSNGKITIFKSDRLEVSEDNNSNNDDNWIDWSDSKIEESIKLIIDHQQTLLNNLSRVKLANIIASLCCAEMLVERKNENGEWFLVKKNVLPQGAPTSPIITNIICKRLDIRLTGLAKRFGLKYSRYADDITFSSEHNVYQVDGEFNKELERIILSQGFSIKESKTRLQKEGHRQEVTGLLVNKKVNVQKRYIKQLRNWLYLLENYSHNEARSIFYNQYFNDKGNVKTGGITIESVIYGKLEYLKMIKGSTSPTYIKLKSRIDQITGRKQEVEISHKESTMFLETKKNREKVKNKLNTPEILDEIFEVGLDEAMKKINTNT